ncbi:helix-turn-helix transcriptional regulator [Ruania alkalisoli]|uniref:Helix-turn-helix transcriptional regulator n=1 Tax=Ruania alkalisoli TaxID=2779775 RepID=A0A7M1SPJ5_9MICO|nr:AraC family transcriptional regulator [Ruania alkalisoli]QOR69371.1 helix-turn-helix transcriptional regulator [Ruania alkalisoli]
MSRIDLEARRLRLADCVARTVEHEPGTTVGPRTQTEIQMLLIHAGTMLVTVDDREPYVVPAGQMCILLPGHADVVAFADGAATRQTLVRGTPVDLTDGMREWLESVRPTRRLSAALTYISREAVTSEQTRLTAHGALVDALATALLWRFVAEFENFPAALPEPIEAARLFIHDNLGRAITLADIAGYAHVTGPYLIRLFREHMGTTPTKYLWDRRVTLGVELLTSSGLPVTRVAERAGFASSFHFARKVKQATGQTPTQLRTSAWSGRDISPG